MITQWNLPEVVLSFVDIDTLPRDEKDMLKMHSEKPCRLHSSGLYTPMGKHFIMACPDPEQAGDSAG